MLELEVDIANIEKEYGQVDVIENSISNPEVCNLLKDFFKARAFADPMIKD